jgi:hypothetical protein
MLETMEGDGGGWSLVVPPRGGNDPRFKELEGSYPSSNSDPHFKMLYLEAIIDHSNYATPQYY